MKKLILFLVVCLSLTHVFCQNSILFYNAEGELEAKYNNNNNVVFWLDTAGMFPVSGSLKILSDSTVSVGDNTIHLSQIVGHNINKSEVRTVGAIVFGVGTIITTLSVLKLRQINQAKTENLEQFFNNVGGGILALMSATGGAMLTGIGVIALLIGINQKIAVSKNRPIIA
ncbi:MAG: hypothetical protein AB8B74_05265 [Crocinitomicaceae bacterium]